MCTSDVCISAVRISDVCISDVYIYLPFKFTSFHYCYSNPTFRITFSIFSRLLRKYVGGARFREHYGQSHMEIQVSFFLYTINSM